MGAASSTAIQPETAFTGASFTRSGRPNQTVAVGLSEEIASLKTACSALAGNGESVRPLRQWSGRMRKERKHYTAEGKVAILRRHLLDKVPVSDLCEELSLKPTVFYRWLKEFFENGAAAFQAQERSHRQVEEKQTPIEFLEKKVQTKDEVPGMKSWPS